MVGSLAAVQKIDSVANISTLAGTLER